MMLMMLTATMPMMLLMLMMLTARIWQRCPHKELSHGKTPCEKARRGG
jgi:hypothetical protein